MATSGAKFTPSAAQKIATAVKQFLGQPIDQRGRPGVVRAGRGNAQWREVLLEMDGGSDGDATTGTEATWTYSVTDINTNALIAVQVPFYGHRVVAQETTPATFGTIIKVQDPANIGYGGAQDLALNGGNGYGYAGGGSGSGASLGSTDQPWRLVSCDESFPGCACDTGSGSSSGEDG